MRRRNSRRLTLVSRFARDRSGSMRFGDNAKMFPIVQNSVERSVRHLFAKTAIPDREVSNKTSADIRMKIEIAQLNSGYAKTSLYNI